MSAPAATAPDVALPYARGGRVRLRAALAAALALLAVLTVAYAGLGRDEARVSPPEVARVLAWHTVGALGVPMAPPAPWADAIVWHFRMPRCVTAILVGVLLAMAGVALQGLLMNPLADPYTVGVSAGAAVGSALAQVLGIGAIAAGLAGMGVAFAAAVGAVALVYALARVGGRVSVHTFLLAGVVVGTFLWSLIPLLMVLGGSPNLQRILFYLIGSVQTVGWSGAALLVPFAVVCGGLLRLWSRDLNLVTLGEESAAHLGVDIEPFKRRVLLVGSLATAAAVSVAGIVGFVGLVVPHLARRMVGPDHRSVLPLAAALGGSLMLGADLLARVWLREMPVGVVTSLIGAPVFCVLLRRRTTSW